MPSNGWLQGARTVSVLSTVRFLEFVVPVLGMFQFKSTTSMSKYKIHFKWKISMFAEKDCNLGNQKSYDGACSTYPDLLKDGSDLWLKAHVQHAISFVHDQVSRAS
jgi:hypothetical protein